jgi:fatty-acyl-CoA synthase
VTFTRHHPHWPPGVPKTLSVPRTSLYFNLEASARRYPDKAALHYYGTDIAYAELLRSTQALAGWLQQRCGVRRGDRVLLYTQNSPQFVIGYYGILRADAVVVPVNPMNRRDELAYYVSDSDARVIVSTQDPGGSAGECGGGGSGRFASPSATCPTLSRAIGWLGGCR